MDLNNLTVRTITGFVFVVVIIGSILLSTYSFFIVFLAIVTGSLLEFYKLAAAANISPQKYPGTICGILFFIISYLVANQFIGTVFLLLLIPLLFVIPVPELFRKQTQPFSNIAWTIFGIIYIAVPFSLLNFINFQFPSGGLIIGYFIILWSYDTAAYLAGISFGRHRLFERVSPKKSWEGAIGGAILTTGVAYIVSLFFTVITFQQWLVVTLIIIVMGTFGDLAESLFKRSIDIKDSGNLFPGHGGFLDRFDAVLLSSPFVFSYLQFIR